MSTPLDTTLRKTSRLVTLHEAGRAVAITLALLLAAVLVAVALDALFALRPVGLLLVDALLLALLLGAVGYVILRFAKQSFDRRRIARLIEDRLALNHSDLINAVQLADAPADGTSASLRDATIARGNQFAATLVPSRIIDKRPLRAACGVALAALATLSLAYLLAPRVFHSVIPRYLNPLGDLPPFTLVQFHFDHPAEVYQGKPASIRVTLTGHNLPEQANIVFLRANSLGYEKDVSQPMLKVEGARDEGTEARRHEGGEKRESEKAKERKIGEGEAEGASTRNSELGTRNFPPGSPSFLMPIDKANDTLDFYIETPAGRSERRTLTVLPVPRFEQATLTIDPPAYTGWTRIIEPIGAKEIRTLQGTKATLTVKSNLPLASGELTNIITFQTGDELSPSRKDVHTLTPVAGDPNSVAITLNLDESFAFSLSLTAANAQRSTSLEPLTGQVIVLPDAVPKVRILEPADRQIIAAEGWKVPVIIEAEDDVKISRIHLFHSTNDSAPSEIPLAITDQGPQIARAQHTFDLAAMHAKPGDAITFFATTHDNFPGVPGGQSSDSETYVIHVISLEEYQKHARSQYQMEEILAEIERFDRLLKELDEQREKLLAEAQALEKRIADQGGVPTSEDEKKLDELNKKLAAYAEAQWKLAKEMRERSEQPSLYDFERAYAQMLAEQANQLDRGAEDATKLARENEFNRKENPDDKTQAQQQLSAMAQQLKRDEERLDEAQAQAKKAEGDMKLIEQADEIMSQSERVKSIIEQQRDLANRLAPFKEKEKLTPAEEIRAQRLAQEQQALKDELADALKQMEEAGKKAEKDLPNMAESAREIAQAIRKLEVEKDQAEAEQSARQGEGAMAHAKAESAAKKLESLMGECEQMGEQGQQDFADAKFRLQKQSLGQGLQQLSQGRNLPKLGEGASASPGQSGMAGMKGSQGKFSVYGPRSTGKESSEKRGGRDGSGKGTGPGSDSSQSTAAESLSPDSATQRGQGAAAIPGVPARYRDLAEQYFRRLAEESK